ncbi:hypothetical protein B0T20DRAFT_416807 [Sordaria brevicollis]|uniref:Zn(2)-C6 fungal-type domain-containing protein n=1 Tax=Sordaria brevicollis TaxID=83679 RepID=A0AAE0UA27_SORBR|nr:hypothetical protein B0T20DRAFT_416807 [Sordaria brevicollis]
MPSGVHNKKLGERLPGPGPSKRKRDLDDNGIPGLTRPDRIPQPRPPQSGNTAPINYLSPSGIKTPSVKLLRGDNAVFDEVISLINDYEGVLSRHESLAANLGAKLTAPRLLRAMESVFEGEIRVLPKDSLGLNQPYKPSWLEVLEFAASNPGEFELTSTDSGDRVCRFSMKNVDVEITEDDWRLITSGALDRFSLVPPKPLKEDERIELATIEIIEDRLHGVIQKADEIAAKARQLNYHLSGRRAAIAGHYALQHSSEVDQNSVRHREWNLDSDLRTFLLRQFLSQASQRSRHASRHASLGGIPNTQSLGSSPSLGSSNRSQSHLPQADIIRSPPTPTPLGLMAQMPPCAGLSHSEHLTLPDLARLPSWEPLSGLNRFVAASQSPIRAVEKLGRGAPINPPCSNCRRIQMSCVKDSENACQGCADRHVLCTWQASSDMARTKDPEEHHPGAIETASETPAGDVGSRLFPTGKANVNGYGRGAGHRLNAQNRERADDSNTKGREVTEGAADDGGP